VWFKAQLVVRRDARRDLLGTPGAYGSSDESPDMGYNLWMTGRKEQRMTTKFDDFVREVEDSSTDEERRELDAARVRFKIGARLLQQRQAAGLSQQQLAAASGIAQADISRIERGQINPTAATLESLGTPLGVTLDYIPAPEFIHA
jgi:ribosome-binding protein aMBF1 (putative translation factor)